MNALPIIVGSLCVMAIAYRYYSAFIAAKVVALDDSRPVPSQLLYDGHNYYPTNKWVLFGHHFAAISGAGPLIGPVLAAQFGYLPGLLWIVIGVCLGGAVQDFLVLSASLRRDGKSLAQIAFWDIGKVAGTAAMIAILFIIVIALAGLGKVVVKALGGEEVRYPAGAKIEYPNQTPTYSKAVIASYGDKKQITYSMPPGCTLIWSGGRMKINEAFELRTREATAERLSSENDVTTLPPSAVRLVNGSSWGTFTIAATIPIALLVGLWMYRIRPGKVVEASIIGGVLTLVAVAVGAWVADHSIGRAFNLSNTG